MAVRIYQLSKEIGMENPELIALLRDRGYEVKSASSTIDNISAESLREEFAPAREEGGEPDGEEPPVVAEPEKAAPPKPLAGAIIRTKEDIERERLQREKEEAERKAQAAPPPSAPPRVTPPGKAPPPLPKGPAVTIRPGAAPGFKPPPRPGGGGSVKPSFPKAILRPEAAKEEAKPEEAKPEPEAQAKPETPAAKDASRVGAPPKLPPRGPAPVAPPRISAPRPVAPPSAKPSVPEADEPAETAPEAEGTEEVAAAPAEPKLTPVQVKSPIVVRDFAGVIGRKPFQIISELMELGIFASMNSIIEEDVATNIARSKGLQLVVRHRGEGGPQKKEEEAKVVDESAFLEPRPPVICILGHVDHGKTTLLDTIRKTNVVAGEHGGITQHIGAYQVEHNGKKITFIDTPGHAAFSNMRARGAEVTDIAVLVVAADDGFMPQTDEALGHARVAKVPVVVAINKIDAPGANLDRVKRQMQERELAPEEWGGETLFAEVSALKGEGIEGLLEAILLQAEVTEGIAANPKADPEGVVLEAQKEIGRGSTASVIVTRGTLKTGMALVCNEHWCRVRQLIDDNGKPVKSVTPGTPVKIVGWSGTPSSGDDFRTVKNERTAKRDAEENERARRVLEAQRTTDDGSAASIEDLFAAIEKTHKKVFRVVVKADVYGTSEAIATSLLGIKSDKINIEVVDAGVGDITRNDVLMASASSASLIAFNVSQENGVPAFAKHHGIRIITGSIIYELIDAVKDGMADLLEPERVEEKIGAAEVRQIFPLGKGFVAGCMVTEGRIVRDRLARLMRKGEMLHQSKVGTLKRFKEDATEVRAGYECGIQMDGFNGYQEGDAIEVFEIKKIKPAL
ncbi:MAG: translation initiation factor IF-2 [Opitutales bacterium]|nr:translation initiation factor IF-2 [Opitutales bacterium]